eukprot:g1917.t1
MLNTASRFDHALELESKSLPSPQDYFVRNHAMGSKKKKDLSYKTFGSSKRDDCQSYLYRNPSNITPSPSAYRIKNKFGELSKSTSKVHIQAFNKQWKKDYSKAQLSKSLSTKSAAEHHIGSEEYLVGPGSYLGLTSFGEKSNRFSKCPTTFGMERRLDLIEVMQRNGTSNSETPGPLAYESMPESKRIGGISKLSIRDQVLKRMKSRDRSQERSISIDTKLRTDYDGLNRKQGLFDGDTVKSCINRMKKSASFSPSFCSPHFGTAKRFESSKQVTALWSPIRSSKNRKSGTYGFGSSSSSTRSSASRTMHSSSVGSLESSYNDDAFHSFLSDADREKFKDIIAMTDDDYRHSSKKKTSHRYGSKEKKTRQTKNIGATKTTFGVALRGTVGKGNATTPGPGAYSIERYNSMLDSLRTSTKNARCQRMVSAMMAKEKSRRLRKNKTMKAPTKPPPATAEMKTKELDTSSSIDAHMKFQKPSLPSEIDLTTLDRYRDGSANGEESKADTSTTLSATYEGKNADTNKYPLPKGMPSGIPSSTPSGYNTPLPNEAPPPTENRPPLPKSKIPSSQPKKPGSNVPLPKERPPPASGAVVKQQPVKRNVPLPKHAPPSNVKKGMPRSRPLPKNNPPKPLLDPPPPNRPPPPQTMPQPTEDEVYSIDI